MASADAELAWSRRNLQTMIGLLIALAVLALLVGLGQGWAVWAGFGVGVVAATAFFVNLYQPPAQQADVLAAASTEERRRAGRLLRRSDPVPERDRRLVEASARGTLRSAGLAAWSGPLVACSQLDALTSPSTHLFGLTVLILGVGLSGFWLWSIVRARASLAENPSGDPGDL